MNIEHTENRFKMDSKIEEMAKALDKMRQEVETLQKKNTMLESTLKAAPSGAYSEKQAEEIGELQAQLLREQINAAADANKDRQSQQKQERKENERRETERVQRAADERLKMHVRKVGTCDGTRSSLVRSWIKNIDAIYETDKSNAPAVAVHTAVGRLSTTLTNARSDNWRAIREVVVATYLGDFEQSARRDLRLLRRKPGQDLIEFLAEFQDLALDGFKDDKNATTQQSIVQALYNALDTPTADRLEREYKPMTLTRATEALREIENYRAMRDVMKESTQKSTAAVNKPGNDKKKDGPTRKEKRAAAQTKAVEEAVAAALEKVGYRPPTAPARPTYRNDQQKRRAPVQQGQNVPFLCYNCQQEGHMARDCLAPESEATRRYRERKQQQGNAPQGGAHAAPQ